MKVKYQSFEYNYGTYSLLFVFPFFVSPRYLKKPKKKNNNNLLLLQVHKSSLYIYIDLGGWVGVQFSLFICFFFLAFQVYLLTIYVSIYLLLMMNTFIYYFTTVFYFFLFFLIFLLSSHNKWFLLLLLLILRMIMSVCCI